MEKQNTGRFQTKQHFYNKLRIDDVEFLGNGKVRDFLRELIFHFKLVVNDCIRWLKNIVGCIMVWHIQ